MNIVFAPYGWEWRIREGELYGELLRPLHPLHHDIAYFAGWKVVVIVLWIPIAIALSLLFDPTFDRTPSRSSCSRSPSGAPTSSGRCTSRPRDDLLLDDARRCDLSSSRSRSSSCCLAGSSRCRSCRTGSRRSRGFCRSSGPSTSRSRHSSVTSPIRSCSAGSRCRSSGSCVGLAIFSSSPGGKAIRRYSAVGLEVNAVRVSAWLLLQLGVLNELQYRVNFSFRSSSRRSPLVTGLIVLWLVYSYTAELNGWSQSELLGVLGIQILMGGLIGTSIQPNMLRLIDEVRDGKLDYALTKPEDAQVLVSVREVRHMAGGRRRVGRGRARGRAHPSRGRRRAGRTLVAFAVALVLGAVMIYCFWLVHRDSGFWVVRMDRRATSSSTASSRPAAGRSASIRRGCGSASPSSFRSRSPSPCRPRRSPRGSTGRRSSSRSVFAVVLFGVHPLVLALRASATTRAPRHECERGADLALRSRRALVGGVQPRWSRRSTSSGRSSSPGSLLSTPHVARGGCSCLTCTPASTSTAATSRPTCSRSHASALMREGLDPPNLYAQAMHELELPRRYRTIIVCGAFGLGGERDHDVEALRRLFEHLEPGGTLVLDNEAPFAQPGLWRCWVKEERNGASARVPRRGRPARHRGRLGARAPLADPRGRSPRATRRHPDASWVEGERRARRRGGAHPRDDAVLHARDRPDARADGLRRHPAPGRVRGPPADE